MKRSSYRHLATASVLTAAALMLAYLEAVLGFLISIPGVKLGLANLATLLLLYTYGVRYAATVALLRICLAALLCAGSVAAGHKAQSHNSDQNKR